MTQKNDELSIWTIYDSPLNYPGEFIARRWALKCGPDAKKSERGKSYPTDDIFRATSLQLIRKEMMRRYLVRIERRPDDDPKIVECWI